MSTFRGTIIPATAFYMFTGGFFCAKILYGSMGLFDWFCFGVFAVTCVSYYVLVFILRRERCGKPKWRWRRSADWIDWRI